MNISSFVNEKWNTQYFDAFGNVRNNILNDEYVITANQSSFLKFYTGGINICFNGRPVKSQ